VTPDGRFLVFVSHGDLTADDTSVSGARQVFRYDAQTGALLRISVGEEGFDDNGNRSAPTPCVPRAQCSEDASIVLVVSGSGRRDPSMSDDGSFVFFQSPVGLTVGAPDDVRIGTEENGDPVYAQNVYEWHEGRVSLISDGRDLSENLGGAAGCSFSSVCLLGSDASGGNVFFVTTDQLVGGDTNTELDIYDARVCEPASPCVSEPVPGLPACAGEECHGVPAGQPGVPGVPSASFNGPGNQSSVVVKPGVLTRAQKLAKALRACRRKHGRARVVCERRARRLFGPAHKSSAKRGGHKAAAGHRGGSGSGGAGGAGGVVRGGSVVRGGGGL